MNFIVKFRCRRGSLCARRMKGWEENVSRCTLSTMSAKILITLPRDCGDSMSRYMGMGG
jgi:hypothetical protein